MRGTCRGALLSVPPELDKRQRTKFSRFANANLGQDMSANCETPASESVSHFLKMN